MSRTCVGILLAAIAAVSLPPAAFAIPFTYVVDRSLSPSQEGGTLTVVGTVTVDDAGPTVTDYAITITSTALGRSFILDSDNSSFLSQNTTLTATPTQLTVDVGTDGIWGPELRDDALSLRIEWFLRDEQGFIEQAFLDFATPDPDADAAVVPNTNPTILFAVPEPGSVLLLALGLGALAARRDRVPAERPAQA